MDCVQPSRARGAPSARLQESAHRPWRAQMRPRRRPSSPRVRCLRRLAQLDHRRFGLRPPRGTDRCNSAALLAPACVAASSSWGGMEALLKFARQRPQLLLMHHRRRRSPEPGWYRGPRPHGLVLSRRCDVDLNISIGWVRNPLFSWRCRLGLLCLAEHEWVGGFRCALHAASNSSASNRPGIVTSRSAARR